MGKISKKVVIKIATPARKTAKTLMPTKAVQRSVSKIATTITTARKTAKRSTRKTAKPAARKTATPVKALYAVSALTKKTASNLWVVFPVGNTSKGLVYSSTVSRDNVRNSARKTFGAVSISGIRARRVKSFRTFTN